METLKIVLFALTLALTFQTLSAQAITARQNAFYKSYEFEKSGNYTAALKELNNVYKSDDYFTNIRLGWLYYLSKQYAQSVKFYEKAISQKPYAIEAIFGLIKPLSATENWDRVKTTYTDILKIGPQNTLANYWLGVIYYNRKEYASANKLFEKGLS